MKECDTVVPVRWLVSVAVPDVVDDAVTVAVIESPAATVKPVKSTAAAGNHSNQAINSSLSRVHDDKNRQKHTIERGPRATHGEVDARLEDGTPASVTINSDPGRGRVAACAARRLARRRHSEGTRNGLEGATASNQDSSRPVDALRKPPSCTQSDVSLTS